MCSVHKELLDYPLLPMGGASPINQCWSMVPRSYTQGAGGGDQISKAYRGRREGLNVCAPVSMARVLAAKDDLLSIRKTNDPSVRSHTQCSINKVLIQSKVMGVVM